MCHGTENVFDLQPNSILKNTIMCYSGDTVRLYIDRMIFTESVAAATGSARLTHN